MISVILMAAFVSMSDPQLPPGVTCEMVREQVTQHGRVKALYWARSNGYSWAQIKEARKCLK